MNTIGKRNRATLAHVVKEKKNTYATEFPALRRHSTTYMCMSIFLSISYPIIVHMRTLNQFGSKIIPQICAICDQEK